MKTQSQHRFAGL